MICGYYVDDFSSSAWEWVAVNNAHYIILVPYISVTENIDKKA